MGDRSKAIWNDPTYFEKRTKMGAEGKLAISETVNASFIPEKK